MNPFDPGYYDETELEAFGFQAIGRNVRIARNCTIIGLEHMAIGSHVRIDGYTTLVAGPEGGLVLGSRIHIGGYCFLAAGDGIVMEDFSGLSQGVRIYSRSDDYSGDSMTNPTVPERYKEVTRGRVRLGRHVIVGSGSVILPGVTIGEGASVGALSLVTRSLAPWGMYFGAPARRLKDRSQRLLALEQALLRDDPSGGGLQETP